MVRKWAEKEMRNLIRIEKAGINAPRPLKVRDTVVIMTFLGITGFELNNFITFNNSS